MPPAQMGFGTSSACDVGFGIWDWDWDGGEEKGREETVRIRSWVKGRGELCCVVVEKGVISHSIVRTSHE